MINTTGNNLGSQAPQVTIVGESFVPGVEGNEAIAAALGLHVAQFPDGEFYVTNGDYLLSPIANYCADAARCIDLLDERGVGIIIKPTIKRVGQKKFEPGFVALFEWRDELHCTAPAQTEDGAAATALWYVASQSVVT